MERHKGSAVPAGDHGRRKAATPRQSTSTSKSLPVCALPGSCTADGPGDPDPGFVQVREARNAEDSRPYRSVSYTLYLIRADFWPTREKDIVTPTC